MEYKILTGEELNEAFLEKIMEVDRECYAGEYVGELANLQARYRKNPKSFVCVMDGDVVAGYINFFPVVSKLWEDITETGMTIRDDDILPEEVEDFSAEKEYDIYVLSVAIREKYRDKAQSGKPTVQILTDAFIAYLNRLQEQGYKIRALAGTAVSDGGRKFLRNCMFSERRQLSDKNVVYVCENEYLEKFLANRLYFKTYRDDVYLFVPYVDNVENPKIPELLKEGETGREKPGKISPIVEKMLEELDGCLQYEYQSDVVEELQRVYLGSFELMHTLDLYPESETERPHIVGEETVYVSLLAHQRSHMYVVMLFIPNCAYSTSQLEDQVAQQFLQIRQKSDVDEYGNYEYEKLNEYLRREYGLLPCGRGKSILCMSKKPETEQEFLNILAGESFNSMRQDFFIRYEELEESAKNNRAIYNYYEAYMTEGVVALIFGESVFQLEKQEANNESAELQKGFERVALTATYVFIVEMIMFQNIALNRVINKVSRALSHDGEVDYAYIMQISEDYAKTMKFWQCNNFKYFGTQKEAEQIRQAFENDEFRENYRSQQDFLEHMVDVKTARIEHRNELTMNIALFMLAIIGAKDYLIQLLHNVYATVGGDLAVEASASGTFDTLFLGIGPLIAIIIYTLRRKHYRENSQRLRKNKMENKRNENKN